LALGFNYGRHAAQLVGLHGALNEGDGMALGNVVEVQTFGGFGLDAYLIDPNSQEIRDMGAHFSGHWKDLGSGQNERGVDVHDLIAGVLEFFQGEIEEDGGIGVFPAGIAGREEATDIAGSHSTQKSVSDRV
jgi:hypothetical protein